MKITPFLKNKEKLQNNKITTIYRHYVQVTRQFDIVVAEQKKNK